MFRPGAVLAVAALLGCACARGPAPPALHDGVLDLSQWDFAAHGTAPVAGEWQICWGELVAPDSPECPGGWQTFPAPRLWSDSSVSSPIGGKGVATYRATLLLPPDAGGLTLRAGAPMTAYRLYVDGEERGGAGQVGTSAATTVAELENRVYGLPRGESEVELLVHVANFEFRGGGLRREWYLGPDEQVATRSAYELLLYAAFAVASVVIGLVFLAQFAFRPSERARGWFGLFALLVGLRILPGSTGGLYQLTMGWAPFSVLLRLEYLNTALLIAVGLLYLRDKIPGAMPRRLTQVLTFAALALVPIHVAAPLDTVQATLPVILVLPPLVILLTIASYGRAARQGLPGARPTLVVAAAFGIGVVHDVVRTQTGWGAPIELFPYFVVVFLASEAQSLLQSFARSFRRAERLAEDLEESHFELQETEQAVVRFVPFDFLRALGKESIREVRAGDQARVELAVVSCDLGGLGAPEPAFKLVNDLLGRIAPVIRARQGFVIQQLGERIVALFPDPAQAVEAGLAIRRAARELAAGGGGASVAIATGTVTLGTVGDGENLASLVVGPPVERTRELHELARESGAGVLLCDATRRALGERPAYPLRELASDGAPVFAIAIEE